MAMFLQWLIATWSLTSAPRSFFSSLSGKDYRHLSPHTCSYHTPRLHDLSTGFTFFFVILLLAAVDFPLMIFSGLLGAEMPFLLCDFVRHC